MRNQDELGHAIRNRNTVNFEYDGFERTVEPYHYGLFGESDHLHCYQISGGSKQGKVPEWKNFKLNKIKMLSVNDEVFTPREKYNPSGSKYKDIKISINDGNQRAFFKK